LGLLHSVVTEGDFILFDIEDFDLTEEQELKWIDSFREPEGKLLLVAEVAGKMVGILAFQAGERKRIRHRGILGIIIAKEYREVGIGRALMERLIRWATEHPVIEKVCLAVLADNTRAINLYKSLGFVEEGRRPREVRFSKDRYVDDILMYRFVKPV